MISYDKKSRVRFRTRDFTFIFYPLKLNRRVVIEISLNKDNRGTLVAGAGS